MYSHYLVVFLGGGLGAITRLFLTRILPPSILNALPLQILCVNVIGCFMIGFLSGLMEATWTPNALVKSFLVTGFLGGFTTFSAFSLDFGLLVEKRLYGYALLYVLCSVIFSITAFFIGFKVIK